MLTPAKRSAALQVAGLTKRYGDRVLFENLTATIPPGLSAVMGPSGTGKTTFLLIAAGIEAPNSGTVIPPDAAGTHPPFTWIMQSANLLPARSALENVALPLLAIGARHTEAHREAAKALELVGLGDLTDRQAAGLSGGERQRVAVARALTSPAPLVLADEPTAALGPDHRALVVQALKAVGASGRVVLVATHDPVVAQACDRTLDLGGADAPN